MPCGFQLVLIAGATISMSAIGLAQETVETYPTRPVRVIVPAAPGGAIDIQARLFAQKLSENLHRTFIVENRPGAGNTIGIAYVAKSPADGQTLLSVAPGFAYSQALYKNLSYDSQSDFAPISLLARTPYLLVVHPSLPARSVRELVALAKARPNQLNAGEPGGSFAHLAMVWLAQSANVKIQIVPYKGTAPAVIDLIAGQLHMTFGNVLSTLPYVKLGKLRLLGISTSARSPSMPNVPTIGEAISGFELYTWHGWVAPVGTPPVIINKLYTELANASKSPEIVKALSSDGGESVGSTPEQFRQYLSSEIDRWRKIVVNLNMKVQ